jgi:RNA polymerase sigma-70 factor (ECF subfamily)
MSVDKKFGDNHLLPSFNATMFDEAAFELFFRNHFKELCGYCQFKYDFDLEAAKDIVHTGFTRLWEHRQAISPELSVKAYIYRIVHNLCLDILKGDKVKRRHIQFLLNQGAETATEDHHPIDFRQLEDVIGKAVEELPEQMRRIFELSRYEELTYAAIAGQLNISVKTVETQMSRALAKLRKKLAYYIAPSVLLLFAALEAGCL